MGWTYTHRQHGMSVRDFLAEQFDYQNASGSGRVIACATVQRSVAYQRALHDGTRYVVGLVCLIKFPTKAADGYNFGYKDMDEGMGPVEDACPRRILEQLSPLDQIPGRNEYARQWRERCWGRIKKPKPKPGDVIEFAAPIQFVNGHESDSFTFVRRSTVRSNADGALYRITNLHRRDFRIVKP